MNEQWLPVPGYEISNLRYDTKTGNVEDAVRHGSFIKPPAISCDRGHEFTIENTGRHSNGTGRYCKTCHHAACARYIKKERK